MDRCISGWRREHPCAALTPSSRFVVKLTQWEAFARNVNCPPRVDKLSGLSSKGTPFVLCQNAYERPREGKVSNGRKPRSPREGPECETKPPFHCERPRVGSGDG